MLFIVIGRDGTDEGALERRKAVREAHLENIESYGAKMIMGAATLSEEGGTMNGSVMMVDFPDRAAFDEWFNNEPYVTGKVWDQVEVIPAQMGPTFAKRLNLV